MGQRPNIVFILADDLGYGDLGVQGHPTIRTPRIDRLAAEGARMTVFYAAPSCSPSRYQFLTGRYSIRGGINDALMPESKAGLARDEVTIADLARAAGYRTAAIGKWHLGTLPGFLPTEHGFDSYFGLLYSNDMIRPWVQTDVPLRLFRNTEALPGEVDVSQLTERYTEEAVAFIRAEPRAAVPALPRALDAARAARRDAALRREVGRRALRRRHRDDRLEHGRGAGRPAGRGRRGAARSSSSPATTGRGRRCRPACWSTRAWCEPTPERAGPLRGSKASTWEGGVRVPFIARWPGRIPAGAVTPRWARRPTCCPTVARAIGAPLPAGRKLDGQDLLPVLAGHVTRRGAPSSSTSTARASKPCATAGGNCA